MADTDDRMMYQDSTNFAHLDSLDDDEDESESDDPNDPQKQILQDELIAAGTPLGRFEQSIGFQAFIVTAIMLNTIVLALEADNPHHPYWGYFDNTFLGIFVFELSLRLFVYRCNFFVNSSKGWNWFDFVVVLLGVLDACAHQLGQVVSAFRVIRLLRVLRAVRLFKNFRELNRLMMGLVNSIESVTWIAVMFAFLIFTSSIFVTKMVGKDVSEFPPDQQKVITEKFGTISDSMVTLSIFLTCDDWSTAARMINERYGWMEIFWIWYIVMGAFLILSLLTGLMADQMMDAREEEESAEAQSVDPDDLDKQLVKLKRRLRRGEVLDLDAFADLVKMPKMVAAMEACGIRLTEPSQVKWLFNSFDRNGSGCLNFFELREAFAQISRHVNAAGKASMLEVMKLEGRLCKLDRCLEAAIGETGGVSAQVRFDQRLETMHAQAGLLTERLVALEVDMKEFFAHMGFRPNA